MDRKKHKISVHGQKFVSMDRPLSTGPARPKNILFKRLKTKKGQTEIDRVPLLLKSENMGFKILTFFSQIFND
jgi:hypothetical protein